MRNRTLQIFVPSPLVREGQDGGSGMRSGECGVRSEELFLLQSTIDNPHSAFEWLPHPVPLPQRERGPRLERWWKFFQLGLARHTLVRTFLLLFFLLLFACASKPEPSKALVKISNVKVWRTDEQTLKVSLDYDLEMGVRLPLPYKEVLVFPLEPKVKLAGTLEPFIVSIGTVGVTLQIPKEAGFDWEDLSDKDTCCIVSLKGMQEEPGTKTARYERISNEVRVLPPQISG